MSFYDFFNGKTVFVTGHTGFKGAWLSIWLKEMGAKVIGYSLEPPYANSLFEITGLKDKIIDIRADVRDFDKLDSTFKEHNPEIVFHLAAQSIVRKSYDQPVETFSTNFMGTVNIMETLRKNNVKSAVIITSDKCYKNVEQTEGYVETDIFSNQDPYSCSKGCAEMAAESFRKSFQLKVATTRAGNVIGGGDWAPDRLVPDVIRALESNSKVIIRNPDSVRPWQFVLEPLSGYLMIAKEQYEGKNLSGGWNFGPDKKSMLTVKEVVEAIIKKWGKGNISIQKDISKHEAGLLYLNCNKSKTKLGWHPKLDIYETVDYITEWYQNYKTEDPYKLCIKQIKNYEAKND
jgi:CDP-glucose 4,6-dehydratase